MTARVVFIDDATGLVTDSFEYPGTDGEVLDARDLVSMALGIESDPLALLARVDADPGYLRAVLDLVPEPLFQGMHGGRLDAIASTRIEGGAKVLCRVVEARRAAEAALQECMV